MHSVHCLNVWGGHCMVGGPVMGVTVGVDFSTSATMGNGLKLQKKKKS